MSFVRTIRTGMSDDRRNRDDGFEVGVLGPLVLRHGNEVYTPTAPKLRNLFTTLIVNSGQVVPVSLLMQELWDVKAPPSWLTTLQTYVLNVRKILAAATRMSVAEVSRELLITKAGGYVFQPGDRSLDLYRYQTLVDTACNHLAEGEDEEAVHTFDLALRVWRGPAFLDVQGGRALESKRRQIEESRLGVLEHKVEAQLRLGHYHEVLTELTALTVENPLHEGLHAQYMCALHSLGRRAEALDVFHGLRANLIEELGLEPGSRVREMHQAILDSDDALVDFRSRRSIPVQARWAPRMTARAY